MSVETRRDFQLATILVGSQLVMIFLVVAIVASPDYSSFFYQTVHEELLQSCQEQNQKPSGESRKLFEDLQSSITKKGVANSSLVLPVQEEVLSQLYRNDPDRLSEHLKSFRDHLNPGRRRGNAELTREIALFKLVRLELVTAEAYLAQGKPRRAELFVNTALEDLKLQRSYFDTEPQRAPVMKIIDLMIKIKDAEGDQSAKASLLLTKKNMSNPTFAAEWYRLHGLKGFFGSYPSEYLVRYYLSSQKTSKAEALEQALTVCSRSNVRYATKIDVLHQLTVEATRTGNKRLAKLAFTAWREFCKGPIRSKPEADLVVALRKVLRVDFFSKAQQQQIYRHVLEASTLNFVDKVEEQMFFDEYVLDRKVVNLWPPRTVADAQAQIREINGLIARCQKKKLNSFSLEIARIYALSFAEKPDMARKEVERLLTPEVIKKASSGQQIEWSELISLVAQTITKGRTDRQAEARQFVEKISSRSNWTITAKMLNMQHLCDYIVADPSLRRKYVDEVLRLSQSKDVSPLYRPTMNFFVLNELFAAGKMDECYREFKRIEQFYGKDSKELAQLLISLMQYRRAFPGYCPEACKFANENPFPTQPFLRAPELVRRWFGERSSEYSYCLEMLSQYEFCRGKLNHARELCLKILENPKASKLKTFLTTRDLLAHIDGKPLSYPAGEVVYAAPESINELFCLGMIYRHVKKLDATARVESLKKQVSEIEMN